MISAWGKANAKGQGPATHPLLAHLLDVAAVADQLLRVPLPGVPRSTLLFLVALHDIGKVSRSFQALAPEAWPEGLLGPRPAQRPSAPPRHDALALHWFEAEINDLLDELVLGQSARRHVWQALAGHHGKPVDLTQTPGRDILCDDCRRVGRALVEQLCQLFQPEPWRLPREKEARALGWHLAGLVTLADWIGSREAWFPYVSPENFGSPEAYWQRARDQARRAVAEANVLPAAIAPGTGLHALFPTIPAPSPLQAWAERVQLPPGPSLTVIEDLTGSGKTEAALVLAHRLMAAGRAEGLFVALPTMATANAMYDRLSEAYRRFFAADETPSLVLAHGRAGLSQAFRETILPDPAAPPLPPGAEAGDEPSEAQCSAWLAEDRRRALLAQVGVGTIDQALFGILPVRHAALRLRGLAGKVLIIDEAHAFDPYMDQEVQTLLRFHAALGGSAILLSATLPLKKRASLTAAFMQGLGIAHSPAPTAAAYPLATLASAEGLREEPCAVRPGLARDLPVRRLPDAAAALAELRRAQGRGAAAVWIRNTVDDVLAAAEALRAAGIVPLVFHARFAMQDRLAIEAEVLRRFGKESAGEERACILLATQVVEQSLDIDFDLLISDLAPMDLLIQRAGRLWRHRDRAARPVPAPDFLVVSPEPVAEPGVDWVKAPLPGTAAVYHDPALLWRGARALFGRGMLRAPADLRALIEEAAEGEVPPALAKAAERAEGDGRAAGGLARQQVLEWQKGYALDSGDWRPDTATPTRLQDDPRVTLRLAVRREGRIVPYARAEEARQAWSLSEISVSRRRIAACPLPEGLAAQALAVRESWGKWLRDAPDVLLAVLEPDGEGWRLVVEDGKGARHDLRYDAGEGLQTP